MIAQQATIRRHLQALKFVDAGDVVKDLTSVCILGSVGLANVPSLDRFDQGSGRGSPRGVPHQS